MAVAYCYRSGQVMIGDRVPKGAMELCRARSPRLREAVEVVARHAYDGKTLLVPGIPEAEDDTQALRAADHFREQLLKRLASRRVRKGRML